VAFFIGGIMDNMYDWVDNTRNFIGGECPHKCSYCYVKSMNYPAVKERYVGKIRLLESEFKKPLKSKSGKPIFVGSCFDMWAKDVPDNMILRALYYLRKFDNQYIFQSKNPYRFVEMISTISNLDILGTTIETNKTSAGYQLSNTMLIHNRFDAMHDLKYYANRTFITIEPILDFHLDTFADLLRYAKPDFVNIGADSKGHNLPEPSWEKVQELITELKKFTEVKCKSNLDRLKKQS
jgi:DNA repair photolyase